MNGGCLSDFCGESKKIVVADDMFQTDDIIYTLIAGSGSVW